MTYEDWKDTKQKEFDALPIFFAFNYEQFKEAMEERGLMVTDTDKIYKLGMGTSDLMLKKSGTLLISRMNCLSL